MINEIIEELNKGFNGIVSDQKVFGITQSVYRESSDGIDFMPGIVNNNGEVIYAGIDDINSLLIYHKTFSSSLSYKNNNGFGDTRQNEDSISFGLIICWDLRKIFIQNADMLLLIRSRMPQMIKGIPNIKYANIIPQGSILNTKQIFESEYSFDKDYLLPLYINFIQINYSIQFGYNPECIEKCINC